MKVTLYYLTIICLITVSSCSKKACMADTKLVITPRNDWINYIEKVSITKINQAEFLVRDSIYKNPEELVSVSEMHISMEDYKALRKKLKKYSKKKIKSAYQFEGYYIKTNYGSFYDYNGKKVKRIKEYLPIIKSGSPPN